MLYCLHDLARYYLVENNNDRLRGGFSKTQHRIAKVLSINDIKITSQLSTAMCVRLRIVCH